MTETTTELDQKGREVFARYFRAEANLLEARAQAYGSFLPQQVCDELDAACEHLLEAAWILDPSEPE